MEAVTAAVVERCTYQHIRDEQNHEVPWVDIQCDGLYCPEEEMAASLKIVLCQGRCSDLHVTALFEHQCHILPLLLLDEAKCKNKVI